MTFREWIEEVYDGDYEDLKHDPNEHIYRLGYEEFCSRNHISILYDD